MCSATDSYDIALSLENIDGAHSVFDGTPIDNDIQNKIDYSKSLVFKDFKIYTDPMIYEFSDIDYPPSHNPVTRGAEADYFSLFEFSAKYDPVPTMLTQNHVPIVKGFMGQTTGFNKKMIKNHIIIMGEDPASDQVKYLHGNLGKGTYTFYGGHDPEDYQHFVGDPPTDLSLHRNSPGYRLILNNILSPLLEKRKKDLNNNFLMWCQKEIIIKNKARGFHLITKEIIQNFSELNKISIGLLHIFLKHTSASLTINENYSQPVRNDFETHFNKMVPEGPKHYTHVEEGADDMPAHIKSSILGNTLIIFKNGSLNLWHLARYIFMRT